MSDQTNWINVVECAKALRCSDTTVNRFRYNGIFKTPLHFERRGTSRNSAVLYNVEAIKETLQKLASAYSKGERLSYWELMAGKFYFFTFTRHDIEPQIKTESLPVTKKPSSDAAHKLATDLMEACKAYLQNSQVK